MKFNIKLTDILLVLLAIYAIVVTYLAFNAKEYTNEEIIQQKQREIELLEIVIDYETQNHNYEMQFSKIHDIVDSLSNDELDSTWSAIDFN